MYLPSIYYGVYQMLQIKNSTKTYTILQLNLICPRLLKIGLTVSCLQPYSTFKISENRNRILNLKTFPVSIPKRILNRNIQKELTKNRRMISNFMLHSVSPTILLHVFNQSPKKHLILVRDSSSRWPEYRLKEQN